MSGLKVLVTDYTWPSTDPEAQVLAEVGATLIIAKTGKEDELVSLVPEADAILTCFEQVTPAVVRAGRKLQVIGRYGIGVDNIAVDEATKLGIPVTNTPGYCVHEVAEHAMAMLLGMARNLFRYNNAIRDDNWALKDGVTLYRVYGRTLGLLGLGKIGQTMAVRASGFGLRVIACDAYMPEDIIRRSNAEPVTLDELFAQSDYLSLHAPLTPETMNIVNADRLKQMKKTAFLINCARGGLVDHDALYQALKNNQIAGAALDVFVPERIPKNHPLLTCSNLVATPHAAFYSEESILELETKAAQNVAAILSGRKPMSCVNPEVLKLERWSHLK